MITPTVAVIGSPSEEEVAAVVVALCARQTSSNASPAGPSTLSLWCVSGHATAGYQGPRSWNASISARRRN